MSLTLLPHELKTIILLFNDVDVIKLCRLLNKDFKNIIDRENLLWKAKFNIKIFAREDSKYKGSHVKINFDGNAKQTKIQYVSCGSLPYRPYLINFIADANVENKIINCKYHCEQYQYDFDISLEIKNNELEIHIELDIDGNYGFDIHFTYELVILPFDNKNKINISHGILKNVNILTYISTWKVSNYSEYNLLHNFVQKKIQLCNNNVQEIHKKSKKYKIYETEEGEEKPVAKGPAIEGRTLFHVNKYCEVYNSTYFEDIVNLNKMECIDVHNVCNLLLEDSANKLMDYLDGILS